MGEVEAERAAPEANHLGVRLNPYDRQRPKPPGKEVGDGAAAEPEEERAVGPHVRQHVGPVAGTQWAVPDQHGLDDAIDEERGLPLILADPYARGLLGHPPGTNEVDHPSRCG